MGLNYRFDGTNEYKTNIYSITLDMSGWEETTVQLVGPVASAVFVYGSNDANALQGVRDGNASLAINFTAIQATPLSTGTAGSSMAAAGEYKINIDARFLRLQGGGANVYRMLFNHYKP